MNAVKRLVEFEYYNGYHHRNPNNTVLKKPYFAEVF